MKIRRLLFLAGGFVAVTSVGLAASKPAGDIDAPVKRQQIVETAARLTRPAVPVPLPADLVSMFNPANFDQPDPEDPRVAAASRSATAGVTPPAGPATPRELLEIIAARIPPTGTMTNLSGETLLTFGTKRVRRGETILVEYNGQSYDLELVAIDRTTFTLRYRGEETTRPIKPTK